jgi:hypothetical protein
MRTRPFGFVLLTAIFGPILLILAVSVLPAADTIEWKNIGPGGGGNMFVSAISPADPRIILMGSDVGGIYRSADGGATWSLRNNALVEETRTGNYNMVGSTFAFDPANPNVVYIGSLKSVDAGWSWKEMVPDHIRGRVTTFAPNSSTTIYVAGLGNVYRTTTGFANGNYDKTTPGNCYSGNGANDCPTSCIPRPWTSSCPNEAVRINSLVVDPGNPSHLLACVGSGDPKVPCLADHCGLYESLSSGDPNTWTKITPVVTPLTLGDFQCNRLAMHASTGTLYMTIRSTAPEEVVAGYQWKDIENWQGGVYRSDSPSFGHTWYSVNGDDSGQLNLFTNSNFQSPVTTPLPCQGFPTGWSPVSGSIVRVSTDDHQEQTTCAMRTGSGTDPSGRMNSECVHLLGGTVYEVSTWARPEGYASCVDPNDPDHLNDPDFDAQTVQGHFTFFSDFNCASPVEFPGYHFYNSNIWNYSHPNADVLQNGWRKYVGRFRSPAVPTVYARLEVATEQQPGLNCAGHTTFDDVTMRKVESLPKAGGNSAIFTFVNYDAIVVDPYDVNKVYVGTFQGSSPDFQLADSAGVWNLYAWQSGVPLWKLVTRSTYDDNVDDSAGDGGIIGPRCGNLKCEGGWENCETCPTDCASTAQVPFPPPPSPACCGKDGCESSDGENEGNCRIDCPAPKLELESPGYGVWTLAIGKDEPVGVQTQGNETLAFGAETILTTNAGISWSQVTSDPVEPSTQTPYPAWKARGDATDVNVFSVVTVHRPGVNRLYYGDGDNGLLYNFDGEDAFAQEGNGWGWGSLTNAGGSAANSIVPDPDDANIVYLGLSANSPQPNNTYIVKGEFTPASPAAESRWCWNFLGTQTAISQTIPSSVQELILTNRDLDPSQRWFIASIYRQGIYRLPYPPVAHCLPASGTWTNLGITWFNGNGPSGEPKGMGVARLIEEPTSKRLYLAVVGDPDVQNSGTGVYEGSPDGLNWCKVSNSAMDGEPVLALATSGTDTVFAGTSMGPHVTGGIWKGTRGTCSCPSNPCIWVWENVLPEPVVSGLAVSPASSSIIYAEAGQLSGAFDYDPYQHAGIYKSTQGGANQTWVRLTDPGLVNPAGGGLMNIFGGRLVFDSADPHLLYATTAGSGLFRGTITCGPVSEGFADTDLDGDPDCSDCAPSNFAINHSATEGASQLSTCYDSVDNDCDDTIDLDCAIPVIPSSPGIISGMGSVTCGSDGNLAASSSNNTYECLRESLVSGQYRLQSVWTFPTSGVPAGTNYELRVDGYRSTGGNDNFNFSFSTPSSSPCTSSDGGTTSIVSITTAGPPDPDAAKAVDLGLVPAGAFCVKVADSKITGDGSNQDTLTLDRLFVVPSPVALGDAATGDVGTVTGDYHATQASENLRETISEAQSGGSNRLWHTWRFDNVPAGSGHKLRFEGFRTLLSGSKIDEFSFQFSTSPTSGFVDISGSTIASTSETAADSSTFGAALSGTIYIRVLDMQKANTGTSQSSVTIDHLVIKTSP